MQANVVDLNVVGEIDAVIFSLINQGAISANIFLQNIGENTLNYHFQQLISGTWTDLVPTPDNYFTGAIMAGQAIGIQLSNSNPQIQLMANASGGSTIWFSVDRLFNRASGGALPLLSY